MPELLEQMYCAQQIVIPPKFPYILKRFCKAAIKTQPYDLLRWSYEYFRALAERRPPPVKLRLEYPVYSTEGGLTRGCLKVIANQLLGQVEVPLKKVRAVWQGFCLDPNELRRVLCLCEVFNRADSVKMLYFVAVAGGLLTKTLTHTMILLCETLTKEPDGGSAAIPVEDFLQMYKFLAKMDASSNVKYLNGYREGYVQPPESVEEEQSAKIEEESEFNLEEIDDFWPPDQPVQRIALINDSVGRTSRISKKLNMPITDAIERDPSVERAGQIERETYMRERKGRAAPSDDVNKKLRELSGTQVESKVETSKEEKPKEEAKDKDGIEIIVYDEDDNIIPYEFYGEPEVEEEITEGEEEEESTIPTAAEEEVKEEEVKKETEEEKVAAFIMECLRSRKERLEDLQTTFEEIAAIVERFMSANYDLGMIAGRQMSTTSGEFIVQHIEREIMEYIDEQIAILPDPDLKKKKAKPEEVQMIRDMLETFLDENMELIAPESEEVEEEEEPIPEVILVYAVPGIGPPVDEDIMKDFEDYALEVSKVQADVFMPRNIRHFLCPPLEKYIEYKYEDEQPKEQVPTGGVITD